MGVTNPHVWGLDFLRLGFTNSYVRGLQILTLRGYKSLRLAFISYVLGLEIRTFEG